MLSLRVNEYELTQINKKVNRTGLTFSSYARNMLLNKDIIVVPEIKTFTKELNHIGNNLNQLTVLAHQGKIHSPNLSETLETLKDIYEELLKIRR